MAPLLPPDIETLASLAAKGVNYVLASSGEIDGRGQVNMMPMVFLGQKMADLARLAEETAKGLDPSDGHSENLYGYFFSRS